MTTRHPALQPYSVGQITVIPWMTKSGDPRETSAVRIIKFVAIKGDPDQLVVFQDPARRGEDGKPIPSSLRASAIQRRLDADAAQQQPQDLATDKQAAYALSLIKQLGPHGWHNSGPGQMLHEPTEADLRAMPKTYASQLIDQLKIELGQYL